MSTAQELIQQGLEQGIEQGIEQGREEVLGTARKAVRNLLVVMFGDLSGEAEERLRTASPDQLEAWSLRAGQAKRLSDVFGSSASSGTKRRAKRSGGGRRR